METFLIKNRTRGMQPFLNYKNAKNGTEREDRSSTQNGTEWDGMERERNDKKRRNENGTIQLKALVLEWNGTISKKSERAQPQVQCTPDHPCAEGEVHSEVDADCQVQYTPDHPCVEGEGHCEVDADCQVQCTPDHPCAEGKGHSEVDADCQVLCTPDHPCAEGEGHCEVVKIVR